MNQYDDLIVDVEKDLRSICVKVKNKGREILSEFDITTPQFNALLYLVFDGEMTLGELSSKMYLACSTITDLLDRMEKSQLVKRYKDEKDKRVYRVKVLEKGNDLIEQVLHHRRKYITDNLKKLNEEERESLAKSIAILNELLVI
ncbi:MULTISPECIES: MarR family winged helix-turn-helix transcriptional regulator [unclassified Fusibacter]|uniref:MarR family winged helix-turn-helix transcriptional regulator n=1 Tax=unclassified Fusibacter TaxID=2624464 RepID=UPI00101273CB|nr:MULTISPECIES: MarR family transcriptional regulator [unclassified Fusibacter]MCK8061003.1 MarR family transcriptional regulator [Fusibacter sp. A2]NPE20543.1 MarR family transcriptional regulator [Fusibacter sp. A1]RXV63741.1 MarR family transcriptional regulator [Fusibacter sp. A1]